jgi:hypothetical protein
VAAQKVRDVDRGYRAFMQRMQKTGQASVLVGIQAAEGGAAAKGSPGVQVIQVGTWNEFGTERIPSRSFIRAWFDEYLGQNKAIAKRLAMVAVRTGKSGTLLDKLGVLFVGQIQRRIAAGIDPANAASTIKRKGSSTPLIDTGQLRSSITYRTENGLGND